MVRRYGSDATRARSSAKLSAHRVGMSGVTEPAYRLVRTARPTAAAPVLDAAQRARRRAPGGPLLVLAGPGTGKTTTLVEAVVARVVAGVAGRADARC